MLNLKNICYFIIIIWITSYIKYIKYKKQIKILKPKFKKNKLTN